MSWNLILAWSFRGRQLAGLIHCTSKCRIMVVDAGMSAISVFFAHLDISYFIPPLLQKEVFVKKETEKTQRPLPPPPPFAIPKLLIVYRPRDPSSFNILASSFLAMESASAGSLGIFLCVSTSTGSSCDRFRISQTIKTAKAAKTRRLPIPTRKLRLDRMTRIALKMRGRFLATWMILRPRRLLLMTCPKLLQAGITLLRALARATDLSIPLRTWA